MTRRTRARQTDGGFEVPLALDRNSIPDLSYIGFTAMIADRPIATLPRSVEADDQSVALFACILRAGVARFPPRWTSSAKSGVGTALTAMSRVWFTLSHGILNEIYYRRPDEACIRDLGLIVIDDQGFFSEEKRHADHQIRSLANGVPAYELVNTHPGHYRITKQIVCDPFRDVVLQRMTFEPLASRAGRYRVFALLAPHLVNAGAGNTAWLGEYKGVPLLFAEGRGAALTLACTVP